MLRFSVDGGQRFQVRAAALVRHESHVLLHRAQADSFWALPGGRVHLGESAEAAVLRELHEELGVQADSSGLACVVDNFLTTAEGFVHELGLYFHVRFTSEANCLDVSRVYLGVEPERSLEFRWFPLADLAKVDVRPAMLIKHLLSCDGICTYLVSRSDAGTAL